MAFTSKEEYLKRYLSGSDSTEKKKKRKKKEKILKIKERSNVRIVDDDVDNQSYLPSNLKNSLDEDIGDDDPTVAEFVDERPDDVKRLEEYRQSNKWKTFQTDVLDSDSPSNIHLRERTHDSDQSPPRRQRHDSDSDQSPPRRQRHDSDSDQSPLRRQRHDSDSDQSPPRRQRHESDSDQSPPRRQRHDSDLSPPRKKRHNSDSDQSPPRWKRHNSDSDQSPPRRKRHGSDSDLSPPRKSSHSKTKDTNSRKISSKHENDRSLHRTNKYSEKNPKYRPHEKGSDVDEKGRAKRTLGGATAGLQSAKDLRRENEKLRKKEDLVFSKMDAEILGKNAKTVVRDKSGKKRNLEAESEEEKIKQAKKAETDAKYKKWGKGLKQSEEQIASLEDALHEASKPLARFKDDMDMDAMLREQEREGDPMLAFIKKKKAKSAPERPVYKGPEPPPNRFKIRPGYRWDGVDRSNGFEKQYFAKKSEKNAVKEMAYKWSVEDM